MRSVPPRGSGWVRCVAGSQKIGFAPTRYREVVLTASNLDSRNPFRFWL